MDIVNIEGKSTVEVKQVIDKAVKILRGKKVGLITTIQHKHKLKEIKKILESHKIKAVIGGQILGCDVNAAKKIKNKVDAFLYIGSGEFHPLGVALGTDKRVIIANPLTNEVNEIKKKDVEDYKKKQKGNLIRFLSSKEIGIIVSTKPGQERLKKAMELKKKLEKENKNAYVFICDNINTDEFENFSFIESWVNTACPRIADDEKRVVNYELAKKNL